MVLTEKIKELRERMGASIAECKKALEKSSGDLEKAIVILEKALGGMAAKKSSRELHAGVIDSYLHGGKIGVLVEVYSETDFVARNPEFKMLVHDIAIHIAASAPLYLDTTSVPEEVMAAERVRFEEEVVALGKSPELAKTIVEGKLKTHFEALCLMTQVFVKNPDKMVGDVVNEAVGKFGENIKVGRFVRFEL
ncbi:MAG: elongation factor Ts [bacterium]|nr:elongation factor Ts [bacterium]